MLDTSKFRSSPGKLPGDVRYTLYPIGVCAIALPDSEQLSVLIICIVFNKFLEIGFRQEKRNVAKRLIHPNLLNETFNRYLWRAPLRRRRTGDKLQQSR